MNRLYLDVHALQVLPPSNINRDDTGSPKTAQFGGVRRSRVSSQSWKSAMRKYFNDNGKEKNVGVRTKKIVDYIVEKAKEINPMIDCELVLEETIKVLTKLKIGITKENETKALFFLGEVQAKNLAKSIIDSIESGNKADEKELKDILASNPSVDIALFGRMVADDPSLNEDASAQVAHAISTHAVQTEFDFFTAADDRSPENNAGAGMLGTVEFNSSTLYRYANVAIHELSKQLNEDKETLKNSISLFIESFIKSLPTGKVNTFANQTLPQTIVVTLRKDRPINMVSAFETPVKAEDGYVKESVEKLAKEYSKVSKLIEEPIISLYINLDDENHQQFGQMKETLNDLIKELSDSLENLLN